MPEINQYMLSLSEVGDALVKKLDLKEGHWMVSLNVQMTAGHFAFNAEQLPLPGAMLQISQIGLNRVPEGVSKPPDALVIDAAKISASDKKEKRKAKAGKEPA